MPATLPPGRERELVTKLRKFLAEAGKDPESFGLDARVVLARHKPDQQLEEFLKWKALGATHFRCNTMGLGFTHPDQHLEALADFQKRAKAAI